MNIKQLVKMATTIIEEPGEILGQRPLHEVPVLGTSPILYMRLDKIRVSE